MKHFDASDDEYLQGLLESVGIEVGSAHRTALLEHLDWVLEWNPRVNLTAITTPREAIRLHIVDSLMVTTAVKAAPLGSLCDLGSGAGFPGLPLAIVAERAGFLVESVKKKSKVIADFLLETGYGAAYSVEAVPERAEEFARHSAESCGVVTARAVTQLGALIELAAPLLVRDGLLVASKGRLNEAELAVAKAACKYTGMQIESAVPYELPEVGESRTLVTVRRTGPSKMPLPRRNGLAQRQPLGSTSPT